MTAPVSLADLDAALGVTAGIPAFALPDLTPDIDLDELLEIAAETDERGPMATLCGLLEALRVRHAGDDTTTSVLAAIEHLHLPSLVDHVRG